MTCQNSLEAKGEEVIKDHYLCGEVDVHVSRGMVERTLGRVRQRRLPVVYTKVVKHLGFAPLPVCLTYLVTTNT